MRTALACMLVSACAFATPPTPAQIQAAAALMPRTQAIVRDCDEVLDGFFAATPSDEQKADTRATAFLATWFIGLSKDLGWELDLMRLESATPEGEKLTALRTRIATSSAEQARLMAIYAEHILQSHELHSASGFAHSIIEECQLHQKRLADFLPKSAAAHDPKKPQDSKAAHSN